MSGASLGPGSAAGVPQHPPSVTGAGPLRGRSQAAARVSGGSAGPSELATGSGAGWAVARNRTGKRWAQQLSAAAMAAAPSNGAVTRERGASREGRGRRGASREGGGVRPGSMAGGAGRLGGGSGAAGPGRLLPPPSAPLSPEAVARRYQPKGNEERFKM